MEQGGNAIDAAAAMCLCLNLLEPQSDGIGGDAPTLIYVAKEKKGLRPPAVGEILRSPDFAEALALMCRTEDENRHQGQQAGI